MIKNKTCKFIGLLILLTSCHSVSYVATYEIKPTETIQTTKIEASKIIENLADNYGKNTKTLFLKDDRYKSIDTIGYYGISYHYFTFTIFSNDLQNVNIRLYYYGVLSKGEGYELFLTALTDSIHKEFSVIKTDIREKRR